MKLRAHEIRKGHGLTLEQACTQLEQMPEGLDWTTASLSRIEKGKQNTTLDRLDAMAKLYGVSVPELFEYDGDNELIKLAWATPSDKVDLAASLLLTVLHHQDPQNSSS